MSISISVNIPPDDVQYLKECYESGQLDVLHWLQGYLHVDACGERLTQGVGEDYLLPLVLRLLAAVPGLLRHEHRWVRFLDTPWELRFTPHRSVTEVEVAEVGQVPSRKVQVPTRALCAALIDAGVGLCQQVQAIVPDVWSLPEFSRLREQLNSVNRLIDDTKD